MKTFSTLIEVRVHMHYIKFGALRENFAGWQNFEQRNLGKILPGPAIWDSRMIAI